MISIDFDQGKLNVLTRKTAICARVTLVSGQYISGTNEHPPLVEERAFLIEQVCERADEIFIPETDLPPLPSQLSLFPLDT